MKLLHSCHNYTF